MEIIKVKKILKKNKNRIQNLQNACICHKKQDLCKIILKYIFCFYITRQDRIDLFFI
jgi:hypothetical protein